MLSTAMMCTGIKEGHNAGTWECAQGPDFTWEALHISKLWGSVQMRIRDVLDLSSGSGVVLDRLEQ